MLNHSLSLFSEQNNVMKTNVSYSMWEITECSIWNWPPLRFQTKKFNKIIPFLMKKLEFSGNFLGSAVFGAWLFFGQADWQWGNFQEKQFSVMWRFPILKIDGVWRLANFGESDFANSIPGKKFVGRVTCKRAIMREGKLANE